MDIETARKMLAAYEAECSCSFPDICPTCEARMGAELAFGDRLEAAWRALMLAVVALEAWWVVAENNDFGDEEWIIARQRTVRALAAWRAL